jgi:hypothetical protein
MTKITAKLLVAPPTRKIRYLQPPILNVPRTKPRAIAPEVRRMPLLGTLVNKVPRSLASLLLDCYLRRALGKTGEIPDFAETGRV